MGYYVLLPLGVVSIIAGCLARKWRYPAIVLGLGFTVLWRLSMSALEQRSRTMFTEHFHSASDVRGRLGAPDLAFDFTEGDSTWIYRVHAWPWESTAVFVVYRDHLMAYSQYDRAIADSPFERRSPKESQAVRRMLKQYFDYDTAVFPRSIPGRKMTETPPNQSSEPTLASGTSPAGQEPRLP